MEKHRVKDNETGLIPPQHEDIQFIIEATNNAAAARQNMNTTKCRKKYRQGQDADKTENQCGEEPRNGTKMH